MRAVRSRSRSGHVAVFDSPLEDFWSCRGLAWQSTHVTLKSQRPWSGVRQTCTSAPLRRVADLRAWGCHALEWGDLRAGLPRALVALVPGTSAIPGQAEHDASLVLEQRFVDTVFVPRASPTQRAMLRSQGTHSLMASLSPFCPSQRNRFESHLFMVHDARPLARSINWRDD